MRDLVSMVLDLIGSLLIVAALAVWVSQYSLALALGVAGGGLLVLSWLPDSQILRRKRARR